MTEKYFPAMTVTDGHDGTAGRAVLHNYYICEIPNVILKCLSRLFNITYMKSAVQIPIDACNMGYQISYVFVVPRSTRLSGSLEVYYIVCWDPILQA